MAKLTDKQIMFCKEYIKDFNATRAAIAAGYTKKGARQVGSDTLAKAYIQDYISKLTEKRNKNLELSAEKVISELMKIGFANEFDIEGFEKLEMKDKIKALEMLARHTGAFNKDDSSKAIITVKIGDDDEE